MAPKVGASSEVGAVSRLFLHLHSVSGPGKRNAAAGERVATILTLAKGTPAQALLQTCPFTGRDPGVAPWVRLPDLPFGPSIWEVSSGRTKPRGLCRWITQLVVEGIHFSRLGCHHEATQ